MKAEEKTVAFMFFSVVMQFVYSLGGGGVETETTITTTTKKKTEFGGGGRGLRGTREEG